MPLYWIEETFSSCDLTLKYRAAILKRTRRKTGLIISTDIITMEGCVRCVISLSMEVHSGWIGVLSWIALSVKTPSVVDGKVIIRELREGD